MNILSYSSGVIISWNFEKGRFDLNKLDEKRDAQFRPASVSERKWKSLNPAGSDGGLVIDAPQRDAATRHQ